MKSCKLIDSKASALFSGKMVFYRVIWSELAMRLFFKLLFLTIVLSPLAAGVLLFFAIETHPRTVDRKSEITPASIERAKRILDQNDPRRLKSGERRTVSTSAADLDLAANYLAQQFGRGSARVKLQADSVEASASIRLPAIPLPLYLNVDLSLSEQSPLARLESLRIGRVPVPPFLAHWLALRLLNFEYPDLNVAALTNAIKKIELSETKLALTYEWQEGLAQQLRMLVLPPDVQERVRAYQLRLVDVSRAVTQKNLSMIELLSELLKLTVERSAGTSAAAEIRAALLVLTYYVNGRSLDAIMPEAKNWPRPAKHRILLNQRDDFPKHFVISAAIAANAGEPLADAVGVYKEVEDSRGGSGFSFNDIAADRAGSKFGEYARGVNGSMLQKKLREGITERDLMPITADLPEFMPEAEFQRRFGGIDGPEYKKMMAEIERRIAALPFYR